MKYLHKKLKHKITEVKSAKEIGRIIRKIRKQQKITQDTIAKISNVGNRFIVELESGKPTMQIDKVIKVLNRMGIGVNLEYFVEEKDNDK